jgi:NADH-quinone oxidoreductase subunit G
MDVVTDDPKIVAERRSIFESVVSNHSNSCQLCVRDGCCELQNLAADLGMDRNNFAHCPKNSPKDVSTDAIEFDHSKCVKCRRCVLICQKMQGVRALTYKRSGDGEAIVPVGGDSLAKSPCVRCGQCALHCPTGAIVEKDDVPAVLEKLSGSKNFCTVQIAPSVRVSIGDAFGLPIGTNCTEKLYTAMRMLGFKAVFDTNFSADLTVMEEAAEFVERFVSGRGELPMMTSCCPAWVDYVEKFYPDLCENLSTAKSPQQMLGVMAKTYFAKARNIDPGTMVQVSAMPCTAKKYELRRNEKMSASGYMDVDISITTRELARLMKMAGIDFANLPDGSVDSILGEYSGAGAIFGTSGGVMEAALRTAHFNLSGMSVFGEAIEMENIRGMSGLRRATVLMNGKEVRVAMVHGLGNAPEILDEVLSAKKSGAAIPYHFIEVMACRGGCLGGGGQPYGICDEIRQKRRDGLYSDDRMRSRRCAHDNPEIKEVYKNFLGMPLSEIAHKLLHV